MERRTSKIKFIVVLLCAILPTPGGSDATPMYASQLAHCGKASINDTGPGKTLVQRQLPWIVNIIAEEGEMSSTCTGTVFTPRLILTSDFCAPRNPTKARYVIHYGFGRQKTVTKAYWNGESPFVVLEVSEPFKADFAICLAIGSSGPSVNETVWSAVRVDGLVASAPDYIRREKWTTNRYTPLCNFICELPSYHCTCAITNEVGGSSCKGEEGKPVMHWDGHNWYLAGLVSNVYHAGNCVYKGSRERSFQRITASDSTEIGMIIDSNKSYYLPEPAEPAEAATAKPTEPAEAEVTEAPCLECRRDEKFPLRPLKEAGVEEVVVTETPRYGCGRGGKLYLGPQREAAQFSLPWIVAIRATVGSQSVKCVGVIMSSYNILTAADCYPRGFENAVYNVYHNSTEVVTGTKLAVRQFRKTTFYEPSLILLVLSSPVALNVPICVACTPFDHHGAHVVAASWAFSDAGGRLVKYQLYYEEWTLPDDPNLCDGEPFNNKSPGNQTLICALAQTDTHYACQSDLGTPVMYWDQGNWYLVGMITHVDVLETGCELRKSRKRIFQWIRN